MCKGGTQQIDLIMISEPSISRGWFQKFDCVATLGCLLIDRNIVREPESLAFGELFYT